MESQHSEDPISSLSLAHLTSLTSLTLVDGAVLALNKGLLRGLPHDDSPVDDNSDEETDEEDSPVRTAALP